MFICLRQIAVCPINHAAAIYTMDQVCVLSDTMEAQGPSLQDPHMGQN